VFFISTAKKFGVTEFVNPNDHDKPVHEVCKKMNHVWRDDSYEPFASVLILIFRL
jgi:Zn-dependent alcohol dehydrogenase